MSFVDLGRFLQRDPNQTAMALMQTAAMHGRGFGAIALAFSLDGLYGDGANLYEYLGSNPWNKRDPLGLASWDPFSMVDDYLAESAGGTAAFLERIVGGVQAATFVGLTIASMLPFPVTGILAEIGASALEGNVSPELQRMRRILGYVSLGALGAVVAKVGFTAIKSAISYVRNFGLRAAIGVALKWSPVGLAMRAWRKAKNLVTGRCGCFVGSTLVWTAAGAVPIDEIEAGAIVLAAQDSGLVTDAIDGEIGEKIVVGIASLVHLTFRHQDGEIETIHTTDEHPFHVVTTGQWTPADILKPGDRLSTIGGDAVLISVAFGAERVPVYNLSIPGSPTYYVGEHGVWVHNCLKGFGKQFQKHARNKSEELRRSAAASGTPQGYWEVDEEAVLEFLKTNLDGDLRAYP